MKNGAQDLMMNNVSEDILIDNRIKNPGKKRIEKFLSRFAFSLVFVVLMWLSANSFFYLPFTPVPVTMQVLTVILSALTLGGFWAAFTQIEYISLGLAGVPVFAGFKGGLAALLGPTGGFIIGFIAAALIVGLIKEKIFKKTYRYPGCYSKNKTMIIFLSCLAGVFVIYLSGYIHFLGYMPVIYGSGFLNPGMGYLFLAAFKLSVAPFLIFDIIKILIVMFVLKISRNI
jgi:biotin transport system substrate-specific component